MIALNIINHINCTKQTKKYAKACAAYMPLKYNFLKWCRKTNQFII